MRYGKIARSCVESSRFFGFLPQTWQPREVQGPGSGSEVWYNRGDHCSRFHRNGHGHSQWECPCSWSLWCLEFSWTLKQSRMDFWGSSRSRVWRCLKCRVCFNMVPYVVRIVGFEPHDCWKRVVEWFGGDSNGSATASGNMSRVACLTFATGPSSQPDFWKFKLFDSHHLSVNMR